jgi:hypothetical protein
VIPPQATSRVRRFQSHPYSSTLAIFLEGIDWGEQATNEAFIYKGIDCWGIS